MSADLWPSLGSTGRRAACCTQQKGASLLRLAPSARSGSPGEKEPQTAPE